ncbi:MAG: tRNA (adenosine(37)-N6)-threonylcarbamoyltransferase complex transferase subunit TsaD [Chloroflexota bacterium]|nr:tRNA (adenosine(37)-N6)-threonylcarbamoyltransferase complex transferase subunit TsaD [Chloroflexota bacterium]
MNILAIETSCDETAAAVVRDGRHILSNVIASQIELHKRYGGVVPELASRQHVLTVVPVLQEAMEQADTGWQQIDAIAVTRGPGLSPALLVGVNAAKGIAFARHKPLLGVNHMEGHIYSNWLIPRSAAEAGETPPEPAFPALCLVVSGGHTELVLITGHGQYKMLGKTVDDAAGEAFDKAARILGLGYPGGPAVQKAAEDGDPARFSFPKATLKGTYDFSFSGVKTALLRKVQEYGFNPTKPLPWQHVGEQTARPQSPHGPIVETTRLLPVADLAASFQAAVAEALVDKTDAAAREFAVREVLVAGGVAANAALRAGLAQRLKVPFRYPPLVLCTDNAAMIAAAGHYRYVDSLQHDFTLDIEPNARYV